MQTSHQISAKSVNICNSYSKFSKVTQKHKCPCTGVIDCQVCVRANGRTSAHLKSVFKMSTVCTKSNASSKTWTPLPDRFIDDHLVEMFTFFDQARLQLHDRRHVAAVHTLLQVNVRTVGWPQSWSDEVWCFVS